MKLQDHENILMRTDRLDDDSVVVNFDVYDTDQREVT